MDRNKKPTLSFDGGKRPVFYAGNLDILKEYSVIGVLASGKAPGPVVWDSYQMFYALRNEQITLAGAWHSPLEEGILDALIEGEVHVAIFLAKGLNASGFQQKFRILDKRSRGLMITPFSEDVTKIMGTKATRLRNELLAASSDVLFIPYIRPRGKLFSMLKGNRSFLKKTYILNRPENEGCSLKARLIDRNDALTLIREAQKAYQQRKK